MAILRDLKVDDNTIIWVARIDTAICLGKKLAKYRSILSLHELHDTYPFWKYVTKKLVPYYKNLVYNEVNRANIARVWYNLSFTPSIIPNKPQAHPLKRDIPIKDKALFQQIINIKKDKKIILYQGSLLNDRNIEPLVKASVKFSDKYCLVLMGKDTDNRIAKFLQINPNLVHISWVSPPDHLYITSHAHIGVAFYDFDCLNSIYCAPNKIWEYSGFSIPIIGQKIPGLLNTVAFNSAGICVDIDFEKEITEAITKVDAKYSTYAANAKQMYDSTDFNKLVKEAIKKI
ncbi:MULTISPECIES: glycosyltransferase family 1 protein [Flavobacteriaceae]|uniref:Glycosyltransferase family 1 protein n=2 Tax=Flavobacteriaceae TaxID=49546 RepID=A0A4Y8AYR0_9FLAO|nr:MULTISPECIES: glycosyltransferase family 1 protein [Flavobacteriaceae]TEW77024.1 glycosyltransferase family 1 protein [Gramella jeungdoensis]